MDWNDKSVLVTGAGGFIGSHLTERLLDLGADVKAFVKYNSRNNWGLLELLSKENLERVDVIMGDLKDPDAVRQAMREVDVLFHLGALIAIPYSYLHPRETVETNVMGTFNVMASAREYEVEKIIHTSTSEVYGTAQYVPIDEKHPLQGQSPYSASKIGADKIAESFFLSYSVPVATIRPFNTYGPRQSARAIIPTIISQALARREVHLGSIRPTRDFTFVSDTVEAYIRVAESHESAGVVLNIGSNLDISIGDLAKKIIEIIDPSIEIVVDEKRMRKTGSEVEKLRADNTIAQNLLGWKPGISLDEGLKKTIEWISDHLDLYKPDMYVI
jgi:NAD dependent epimerase/dehydratase